MVTNIKVIQKNIKQSCKCILFAKYKEELFLKNDFEHAKEKLQIFSSFQSKICSIEQKIKPKMIQITQSQIKEGLHNILETINQCQCYFKDTAKIYIVCLLNLSKKKIKKLLNFYSHIKEIFSKFKYFEDQTILGQIQKIECKIKIPIVQIQKVIQKLAQSDQNLKQILLKWEQQEKMLMNFTQLHLTKEKKENLQEMLQRISQKDMIKEIYRQLSHSQLQFGRKSKELFEKIKIQNSGTILDTHGNQSKQNYDNFNVKPIKVKPTEVKQIEFKLIEVKPIQEIFQQQNSQDFPLRYHQKSFFTTLGNHGQQLRNKSSQKTKKRLKSQKRTKEEGLNQFQLFDSYIKVLYFNKKSYEYVFKLVQSSLQEMLVQLLQSKSSNISRLSIISQDIILDEFVVHKAQSKLNSTKNLQQELIESYKKSIIYRNYFLDKRFSISQIGNLYVLCHENKIMDLFEFIVKNTWKKIDNFQIKYERLLIIIHSFKFEQNSIIIKIIFKIIEQIKKRKNLMAFLINHSKQQIMEHLQNSEMFQDEYIHPISEIKIAKEIEKKISNSANEESRDTNQEQLGIINAIIVKEVNNKKQTPEETRENTPEEETFKVIKKEKYYNIERQ